jgi:hypothetical protein
VQTPRFIVRHRGLVTLLLTTLAASDVAYRLLLRGVVRRALGMEQAPRF